MKLTLTIYILFSALSAFSQAPAIQWEKSYPGYSGEGDVTARSIDQTSDHGYIIAGFSFPKCWIVKIDSDGNLQWEKNYGGSARDQPCKIRITSDGGYIFTARSFSNDGDVTGHHGSTREPDVWVVKLDANGNIVWEKSYGGTDYDQPFDIQQTFDGGYIVAASTWSNNREVTGNHGAEDYWILKLNSSGDIEWDKCYGGSSLEEPCSILQLQGGGYFVTGNTISNDGDVTGHHGNQDVWILRLSKTGKLEGEECLPNEQDQTSWAACLARNGGYVIAGIGGDFPHYGVFCHGQGDFMLLKVSKRGKLDTACAMGGSASDCAFAVAPTRDGGYVVTGYTFSGDGDVTGHHCGDNTTGFCDATDYWVVKVDSLLRMQWERALGGEGDDEPYAIQQTDDGGYIVAGYSGSFYKGDVTLPNYGDWIVKLAPDHNSPSTISDKKEISSFSDKNLSIYPNPASNEVNVSFPFSNNIITVSDLTGREVMKWNVESGNLKMIDINLLQAGVYILYIRDEKDNIVASGKVFKQ